METAVMKEHFEQSQTKWSTLYNNHRDHYQRLLELFHHERKLHAETKKRTKDAKKSGKKEIEKLREMIEKGNQEVAKLREQADKDRVEADKQRVVAEQNGKWEKRFVEEEKLRKSSEMRTVEVEKKLEEAKHLQKKTESTRLGTELRCGAYMQKIKDLQGQLEEAKTGQKATEDLRLSAENRCTELVRNRDDLQTSLDRLQKRCAEVEQQHTADVDILKSERERFEKELLAKKAEKNAWIEKWKRDLQEQENEK